MGLMTAVYVPVPPVQLSVIVVPPTVGVASTGGPVKFSVVLLLQEYNTLSVAVAVRVPLPDDVGVYVNEVVQTLASSVLQVLVLIVCPFRLTVIVPGNCAYCGSVRA